MTKGDRGQLRGMEGLVEIGGMRGTSGTMRGIWWMGRQGEWGWGSYGDCRNRGKG